MIGSDLFERHRARLLELLKHLAYEEREVKLVSGRLSNFYIDCKQAVLSAEGHFLVGWLVGRLIAERAPEVEAVGGLTMGADPLASAVSTMSYLAGRPLHAFYVRKEPKGHGSNQWLEGTKSLRPDMPVAILEDVVTTGGSALEGDNTRARVWPQGSPHRGPGRSGRGGPGGPDRRGTGGDSVQ